MNYKLIQDFIPIYEKFGIIENNSNGKIEIAIVTDTNIPKPYEDSNSVVETHGKFKFNLKENEHLYARAYNRGTGCINVFEVIDEVGSDFDPNQYYTKQKSDERHMRKNTQITASEITFNDGKTFQDKLNDGTLKGNDGKSAFNELGQIEYPNGAKEWIA